MERCITSDYIQGVIDMVGKEHPEHIQLCVLSVLDSEVWLSDEESKYLLKILLSTWKELQ